MDAIFHLKVIVFVVILTYILMLQPFTFCRFQHRLDLATSGVLCLCRTKKSAGKMFQEFQKRSVLKYYVALVSTYDYIINYAASNILVMYLLSYQTVRLSMFCRAGAQERSQEFV